MDKEFHRQKSKEHYQKYREKYKARNASIRARNQQIAIDHKQGGCTVCPEKDPVCLDFHHLGDKEHTISDMMAKAPVQTLLDEIKKCVVLCANCHRKLHAGKLQLE